jgi:hypothetical protein
MNDASTTLPSTHSNPDYTRYVPNYQRATLILEVDDVVLTSTTFKREFVDRNRPCIVRGAARHWPAYEKWRSTEYLRNVCGDARVRIWKEPLAEGDIVGSSPKKVEWLKRYHSESASAPNARFSDFLDRVADAQPMEKDLLFLYNLDVGPKSPFAALGKDIGTYSFLPRPWRTPFNMHKHAGCFFYHQSITDWHYHVTAEALQTQILGTKEVLLLPPTNEVWAYMRTIQASELYSYSADLTAFPRARDVAPFRAVLHPGDALFIPNYWWHLVSTRGNHGLGATVPIWWDSPFHVQMNFDFPAMRQGVRHLLTSTSRATHWRWPPIAAGILWSMAHRVLRPQDRPWLSD